MDLALTMRLLALEAAAVEVCTALEQAGVPVILLKGPVTNAWLYDGPDARPYGDIDLLISPLQQDETERVLSALGFVDVHAMHLGVHRPEHEAMWARGDVALDVHTRLAGISRSRAQEAWDRFEAGSEPFVLQGRTVRSLPIAARALHLCLHVSQSKGDVKALRDLRVGLERLPSSVWSEAGALASELEARTAFSLGLQQDPEGSLILSQSDVGGRSDLGSVLRAGGALAEAHALADLRGLTGAEKALRVRGWFASESGSRIPVRNRISAAGRLLVGGAQLVRAWWSIRRRAGRP